MISHRKVKALKNHWFQILLALADHDLHGLAIMREVSQRTEKRMHLWPGMLYGSLKRMADEDLVTEIEPSADAKSGGGRPRYYSITASGRRALVAEVQCLDTFVQAARAKRLLDDPTSS